MSHALTHARALDRIALCALVVEELRRDLTLTTDPERRADLLLAVEDLGGTVIELVTEVRDAAWHAPSPDALPPSREGALATRNWALRELGVDPDDVEETDED